MGVPVANNLQGTLVGRVVLSDEPTETRPGRSDTARPFGAARGFGPGLEALPAAGIEPGRRYRLLEKIGSGGMGVVYRAEDSKLGRQVALKFLPEAARCDFRVQRRFRREARLASALNHPNICTVHDIDEQDGKLFISMELLEGCTLAQRLASGAMPVAEVIEVGIQVAEALAAAHAAGMIHRDIKPANIFLTRDGVAKVLDFGLAKPVESDDHAESSVVTFPNGQNSITRAGTTPGTGAYMSPEQARGERLDTRTDLFSFGAVLYEMVTGRHAFQGSTAAVLFDQILNREPEGGETPEIPAGISGIIAKALRKDRRERYASAAGIARELRSARQN